MQTIAIVMGRNYTSRLGMIRAAGQAGCDVAVIKTDPFEKTCGKKDKIDLGSKYVKEYHCLKEPDDEGLIRLILQYSEAHPGEVVLLPTDDYTASVIDRNADRLQGKCLFPSICGIPGEVVRFMDKHTQKQLAKDAGLPVPEAWTAEFDPERNTFAVPKGITFPCFVKPQVSVQGSKLMMKKCSSEQELTEHLRNIDQSRGSKENNCTLLIEQFIDIEKEYDIPGFADKDTVILPAFIEKGLIHRGVTGTGRLIDSKQFPETTERLKQMIKGLGFTGLIDIELYESKGVIYFNELNLRFGATGFAMTGSGVNLPELLIRTLQGNTKDLDGVVLPSERSFVSEKVCLQKCRVGDISWNAFRRILDEADITFVKSDDDPKPYRAFLRETRIFRIKHGILKLLRRK